MLTGPTLYFDRSLGKALPEALRLLQVPNVIHHHSPPEAAGLKRRRGHNGMFADNAPDDEWLSFVGQRGWIGFSQDYSMHREAAPLAAIRQNNTKVFYLWGAEANRWAKMRAFAEAFDRIIAEAVATKRPFVRRITKAGKVEVIQI